MSASIDPQMLLDNVQDIQPESFQNGPTAAADVSGLDEAHTTSADGLVFEDFADFSKLLPTFVKPDQPCEYCRARHLDCHMYFGKVTCTACDALFRTCSFANVGAREHGLGHSTNQGIVDTLHIVEEDVCTNRGALTGTKQLRSMMTKSNSAASRADAVKKAAPRFSKPAIRILRSWYESHLDYPYPSEDDKIELERQTGLKSTQITTWLANTRRRSKNSVAKKDLSPSTASSTQPIDMPANAMAREWRDLNPFERWQHSPPENEPAPFDAIADAVAASEFRPEPASSPESITRRLDSTSGTSFSIKQAASITSLETSRESSNSKSVNSSAAWSHGSASSFGSFGSFGSGLHGKRDRQRKRKARAVPIRRGNSNDQKRIYQCTFCTDRFKTKYDWTRHEKTLHLSLEKWVCNPCGAIEVDPQSGTQICTYCRAENPDHAHVENHGHGDCVSKGVEARTFFRKDHLRQHLRLVHHCELLPTMESWKQSADTISSRCGFCATRFASWSDRNDHLASHFRQGAQMKDWKRCRGLDPEVAAHVLNAMPPYLIGIESSSPIPFSASNARDTCHSWALSGSGDQEGNTCLDSNRQAAARNPNKPTCWEILSVLMAKFVKERAAAGLVVTDEMLKKESRVVLYGEDDDWNQSPFDDPTYIDLWKKAYAHKMLPDVLGGVGETVPEDLELYVDLGMRIPFSVQQERMKGSRPASPNVPQFGMNTPSSNSISPTAQPVSLMHRPSDFNLTMYEDLPLYASRVAHLASPPLRNPLIYDQALDTPAVSDLNNSVAHASTDRSDSLAEVEFILDPADVEKMLADMGDLGQFDHPQQQQESPPLDQAVSILDMMQITQHSQPVDGCYDPMEFINIDMVDNGDMAPGQDAPLSNPQGLAIYDAPSMVMDEEFDFDLSF